MEYLDDQHRLLRYLAKPHGLGVVMLAHLKCLKPEGKDYEAIVEIKQRKEAGEPVNEVIPFTDAEFDLDKVRALFKDYGIMDETRFDAALDQLRAGGHVQGFTATKTGTVLFESMEAARLAELKLRDNTKP